jgi:hypothetical protein
MKPSRRIPAILITLCLGFFCLNLTGVISDAQAQQVQVTAADPSSSAQGTINLNVRVTGKGFKNGAKAKWFVTGTTDPGGVTVNSTTFVSSTELSANITVADTAVIANFDIQVLNSDGRGGKGTELFAVTAKGPTSCGTDITNLSISIFKYTDATRTTTYNLQPDQTNADGSPVPYVSGKSKGSSIDGRLNISNCGYDLTLNLNSSNRLINLKFPQGSILGTTATSKGFNADRVGNIPITDGGSNFLNWCSTASDNYAGCGVDAAGYFVRRSFGTSPQAGGNSSYGLRFSYSPFDLNNIVAAGTAYVKVYHPDANTWTLIPDQVAPPSGVTDPNATTGEWAVLLDKNTDPMTVLSYHLLPFKIVVKRQ